MQQPDPKHIVDEIVDSISEPALTEPGQADTTPATEPKKPKPGRKDDSAPPDRA